MSELSFTHEHCSEIADYVWQLPPHSQIAPAQMLALGRRLFEHGAMVESIEFDTDCEHIQVTISTAAGVGLTSLSINETGMLIPQYNGQRFTAVDEPGIMKPAFRYLNPVYHHGDCEARTSMYEFMSRRCVAVALYNGLLPHINEAGVMIGRATRDVTNPGQSGAFFSIRGMGFDETNRAYNDSQVYEVVRGANVQGLVGDTTTIGYMQQADIEWLNTEFLDARSQICIAPFGDTVEITVPHDQPVYIEGILARSARVMTRVDGYRLVGYVI